MVLRGDARTCVAHGYSYAVRFVLTLASPVRDRKFLGCAALPKMQISAHGDATTCRGVLQRVVEQIRNGLLHLLVIELENRQIVVEGGLEPNVVALKYLVPTCSQFGQAIAQIVITQIEHELAAFQRRIVQEHGNQANQPLTAI